MTNSMSASMARTPDKPRTDDRYPSRFDTRAHVSNRHDPVVYGSADDGPLSASDLRFYDDNGYLLTAVDSRTNPASTAGTAQHDLDLVSG